MRIFYLILCFICLCDLLHAQTVRISYEATRLRTKNAGRLNRPSNMKSNFMHNSDFPIRLIFN